MAAERWFLFVRFLLLAHVSFAASVDPTVEIVFFYLENSTNASLIQLNSDDRVGYISLRTI